MSFPGKNLASLIKHPETISYFELNPVAGKEFLLPWLPEVEKIQLVLSQF